MIYNQYRGGVSPSRVSLANLIARGTYSDSWEV